MTKTYNDIEAVTRLLEEKERDLELAARIGQTLLEKNKDYEEKNEKLEELLVQAQETIKQLKHELSMKEELLRFYTQDCDGSDTQSTPDSGDGTVPHLQKKVRSLEEENLHLRLETSQLQSETDSLEEKEAKLVSDCVHQLEELHQQLEQFARELSEKTEECSSQKEEITNLLSQVVALQKRNKTLTVENLDLQKTLGASQDSQRYLSREIVELKEKNEQISELLEENQEEIRRLRSKNRPNAVRHQYMSSSLLSVPSDSLASELENSLRSEIDYPRGYSPMDRRRHNWKVFETAKAAKKASQGSSCSASHMTQESSNQSFLGVIGAESCESASVSARSSMYFSDGESGISDGYNGDMESLYCASQKLGRPGIPGSNDLQTALRRLSLRRANELNEIDYRREERERLSKSRLDSESETEMDAHMTGRRTPDSTISAGSGLSYLSMTGSSNNPYYRMPEKLQIVKPIEGSVTLRHWQQLATPHLGGIFESRPGIQIKGERKLDLDPEVYTLSDYEEDDEDLADCPTRFQESPAVYTFTNSTVKHPSEASSDVEDEDDLSVATLTDEETYLTNTSQKSSTPRMASGFHRGVREKRDAGTSTYSMSLGLASILNERDLLTTPPEGTPPVKTISSNPARFPSLVTESLYNTSSPKHQTTTSMTFSTATGTVTSVIPLSSRKQSDGFQSGSRSLDFGSTESGSAGPENTAGNVLQKLKSTGSNLFGYLATGAATIGGARPNSLPVTPVSVATVSTATMDQTNADSLVTVVSSSSETKSTGLSSFISHRTAGGVIGALANFKRNGIL